MTNGGKRIDTWSVAVADTWVALVTAANNLGNLSRHGNYPRWAALEAKADEIDAACIALEVLVEEGKALLKGGS